MPALRLPPGADGKVDLETLHRLVRLPDCPAQFAALLRTLAKGMNRQVILAVHERALFDYLTLELSPAFPSDSLIAAEVSRNFEGEAIAAPRALNFEADRAIAA